MKKRKKAPSPSPALTIDAAAVTEAVKSRYPQKAKVTLYLDKELHKEFRANCKRANLVMSDVAEQLLRSFNESYGK